MRTAAEIPADSVRRRCRQALADQHKRARVDGQEIDYDLGALLDLVHATSACPYCGNLIPAGALTFDHRMPTPRGGVHQLANLTACCVPCNLAKGCLTSEEFRQLRAVLRTMHPRAFTDVLARLRSGGARYARGRRKGAAS
jgi:5-methylcytosine-specific restriction endonuclease McrA